MVNNQRFDIVTMFYVLLHTSLNEKGDAIGALERAIAEGTLVATNERIKGLQPYKIFKKTIGTTYIYRKC